MTRTLHTAVDRAIQRLNAVWPAIGKRPDTQTEIRKIIDRYVERDGLDVLPEDLERGVDLMLDLRGVDDYPPGPADIGGMVLTARYRRHGAQKLNAGGPREVILPVAGRTCLGCHGTLELLPDNTLWCAACRSTQVVEKTERDGRIRIRTRLLDIEVAQLTFITSDAPPITAEEGLARVKAVLERLRGGMTVKDEPTTGWRKREAA